MSDKLVAFENGERFLTYVDGEPRVWTVDRGVPRSAYSPDPMQELRLAMGHCRYCEHWVTDHNNTTGCTRDCRCMATPAEARRETQGGRHELPAA